MSKTPWRFPENLSLVYLQPFLQGSTLVLSSGCSYIQFVSSGLILWGLASDWCGHMVPDWLGMRSDQAKVWLQNAV